MPIFAFSCGLRRVTLRCPYDSTTFYDLRSLYDFVIVCTITNLTNRKTVARRHVVRRVPYGDLTMIVRSPHDFCMIVWGQKSCSDRRVSPRVMPSRLHLPRLLYDFSVCDFPYDILDIVGVNGQCVCLKFMRASYDFLFWLSSMFRVRTVRRS